jgi:osmotically-inducible protein OsmY
MTREADIIRQVRGLLEREPRINLHRYPIRIDVAEGAIVLEGEVEDIAAKKLALELAAGVQDVRGVIDRLHVRPTERKGDGAIRDVLCQALAQAPELRNCALRFRAPDRVELLRAAPGDGAGEIEVAIDDGVVTLEGTVISLSHKRIAGVLAWWTPGVRDVINSLDVAPPEQDTDDEVVDALRLVFEMDPLLRDAAILARADHYVVTLEGQVRTEAQRRRAELDAWALFAVDRVINRIEVGAR